MEHFVQFEDVSKYYQTGSVRIAAADHLNFYVDKGEFCIIVGPSGAGKTTLLNILGGMDTCDEGHVWLDGQDVSHFSEKELTTYRRYDVGFVFQFYNLVQNLTALENVELASEICRDPLDPAATLESVGLGERLTTSLPSFRAASSSVSPLPGRWPRTQSSCSAMSPPVRWTTRPASRCWPCSSAPAAKQGAPSSSLPTTRP